MIHPTLQQLRLLGCQAGDRVWVRLLLPKNIPLDVALRQGMAFEPESGKIARIPIDGYLTLTDDSFSFTRIYASGKEPKSYSDGPSILAHFNRMGYGIYNVVNPGGRDDDQITGGRVLFYECDDCSKDEQWARLQRLEAMHGQRATLVIETAKSLHCYFVLEVTLAPEQWIKLQQRLIQCQDSDASIFNPSRLMRLAGFTHWKWDEGTSDLASSPVTIAQVSDSVFTLARFDAILPQWDAERWNKGSHQSGDRIPTNAGDNQWDIRNFAHHLEGFNPNGRRRGWWTCKCPAHNGETDNSLHINEATGAFKCHAGCDSKAVYDAALAVAKAAGYQVTEGKRCGGGRQHPIPLPTYKLTYPIATLLSAEYIGDVVIPESEKLVGLVARMGGGKTYRMEKLVEEAHGKGQRVLVLSYRQQLARQLAHRFGIAYKDEVRQQGSEGDRELGLALCVDSLHPNSEVRFNASEWANALIIIDEAESVLWHLLYSTTCEDERLSILRQFRELVCLALSPTNGGRVVLADADLSDLPIDFVLKTAEQPQLQPYIIQNIWKPEKGWMVHLYAQAEALTLAMEQAIASGGKQLILVNAQKPKSKWAAQNIENSIQEKFPTLSIIRIDSETVAEPGHPAYGCMEHINSTLARHDIAICTTVIESGVSIELFGHYQNVWIIAPGVSPENGVRQFMGRLRDNDVPRHLYAAEKGCNFAFVAGREHEAKTLLETAHKVGKLNLSLLKDSAFTVDLDGSVQSNTAALEAWGRFGARINQGFYNYRSAITEGLKTAGHQIIQVEAIAKDEAKAISKKMATVRDKSHQAYCAAVPQAQMPETAEEYEALKQQRAKTADERLSCHHYELKQRYQVDITADLVDKDADGYFSMVRNHYFLTIGSEHMKGRDRERIEAIAPDGQVWLPDMNRRTISARMAALEAVGFKSLYERAIAGEKLSSYDPNVAEFHHKVSTLQGVQELIGIAPQQSPIATLQEYFNSILGFRLMKAEQRTVVLVDTDGAPMMDEKGKQMKRRYWLYVYPTMEGIAAAGEDAPKFHPFDGRLQIMQAWLQRDKAKQSSSQSSPLLVSAEVAIAPAPVETLPAIEVSSISAPELHTKSHIDLSKAFDVQREPACAASPRVESRGEPDWAGLPPNEVEMYLEAWHGCSTDEQRAAVLDVVLAVVGGAS